jgi:hypothetical protein
LALAKQRRGTDRRRAPTPAFSRYTLVGRRLRNRRDADPAGRYYVDRSDGRYQLMLWGLALLVSVDALSTLFILDSGGGESNPLMAWLYGHGSAWFLGVKLGTLAAALPLLTVHRFFPVARLGLALLLAIYGWVMFVHAEVLWRLLA